MTVGTDRQKFRIGKESMGFTGPTHVWSRNNAEINGFLGIS